MLVLLFPNKLRGVCLHTGSVHSARSFAIDEIAFLILGSSDYKTVAISCVL